MERFVSLDRWPDGVQLPLDLADRVSFDAGRRRLVFRGFMSKVDFDRLCMLGDDWSYRRALEDLFRLCTPEDDHPSGLFRRVFTALAGRN